MASSFHSDLSKFPALEVVKAKRWPKVELHLHLDGSLSPEFIAQRALVRGIQLPSSPERLRSYLMDRKLDKLRKDDNRVDKGDNWPVFDFCNQFLQTSNELTKATQDLLIRLSEDGVVYAEIRFCPELHTLEGLSPDEVVQAVIAGLRSQTLVTGGIILVALRSKSAEHAVDTARLAAKYLQRLASDPLGVVGMDVAGDEGGYPLASDQHLMAAGLEEAARLGVPITIHAGEWPEKFGSVDNLRWAASKNYTRRIGHAIALRSAQNVTETLMKNNITVEVCLTSNIGNGFKVPNYSVHPVRLMHEKGVSFSLSSDNLLLSGDHLHAPSPTAELLHLVHDVGLGWDAARKAVIDGLRAAFSPSVNEEFIQKMEGLLV